jgi:proline racemase
MIHAVEAHACGEPGRVIVGGFPDPPGSTMFEKMTYLRDHADWLRKLMLREPRGYPADCCNILLAPTVQAADAGFVIMEQVEYPPMSGSNTICVVTVLLETGIVEMVEPVTCLTLETPAGLISVEAACAGGKVTSVEFRNVPAFAVHLDAHVEVPQLGTVAVDVAWGGMFYVLAEAKQLGFALTPDEGGEIARATEMIKAATVEQLPVSHPENPEIRDVSIGQLYGPSPTPGISRRNAVTISSGTLDWERPETWKGVLDRSPCGTGTCAAMACLHARGQLAPGETFRHESILGTVFTGRIVEETTVGEHRAVVPTLAGTAWITGFTQYVVDPTDPFPEGYTLGDLWAGSTA